MEELEGVMDESSRAEKSRSRAPKRTHEKSRLRRCRNLPDKESDKDSFEIKIKKKKKKKKKTTTTTKNLQNKSKKKPNLKLQINYGFENYYPLPHYFHGVPDFPDSTFNDHAFMTTEKNDPADPYNIGAITQLADETKANKSPYCISHTMFAIDHFNFSNKTKLELVKILNVNNWLIDGYMIFTRFVAKDLDTGKTAIYRAAVHRFAYYKKMFHFAQEVE